MQKVSVIIPTILRCPKVLVACVKTLLKDDAVGEIIVIKNTQEDLPNGFPLGNRVKVFIQSENLYVNKSWNTGVFWAENDIVALVNDDLIPEQNMVSKILSKGWLSDDKVGLLGLDIWALTSPINDNTQEILETNESEITELVELPVSDGIGDWGSFIIGRKECFYPIPEELKIVWGDHYLIRKNVLNGRKCYIMKNSRCRHIHSCTCGSPGFEEELASDHCIWNDVLSKEFEELLHKFTIIIPTLLLREDILRILIKTIAEDFAVDEIIIINNNPNKKIAFDIEKVSVYNQKENLYVNKSWNLGVSLAKNKLIGLLNDDILIGENFFSTIIKNHILPNPQTGLIGIWNYQGFENENDLSIPVQVDDLIFTVPTPLESLGDWGMCILFEKENYYKIPEELKIIYGDNYLIEKNLQNNKEARSVCNLPIKHIHSLSTRDDYFDQVITEDIDFWNNNKERLLKD